MAAAYGGYHIPTMDQVDTSLPLSWERPKKVKWVESLQ
jgi:hypothetical protein